VYDAEIPADDWFYILDTQDRFFAPLDGKVASRSQAANTITLSGNATRTEVRKQLRWFVRAPPANA
jgi:hypothetical protein